MSIEARIKELLNSIPKEVTLIAASKTRTVEEINLAYSLGISNFGENKVQELIEKYDKVNKNIKWHLIGKLQTNKVKYIVGKVELIHSLDSIKLLNEIEKRYKAENLIAEVLIEVNIGSEEAKSGILLDDLKELINQCEKCSFVKVRGLMSIIPVGNEEECKVYFKKMKLLFEEMRNYHYNNISMNYLSMGMSGDYTVAIEEGSNMIRLGEKIFGKRIYRG